MKRIFILFSFFIPLVTFAQNTPHGASDFAMGNTGVANSSVWSVNNNQAAMALEDATSIAIYYMNTVAVPELANASVAFNYKLKGNGALGLLYSSFGFSQYNRQRLGFGYGLQLTDGLYAGAGLNMIMIHQPDYYGNIYTVTAEASLLYKPNEKLSIGSHLYNFVRTKYIASDNEPMIFTLGAGYRFSEKAYATLEFEKNILLPLSLKWGASYMLIEDFDVYLGGILQGATYNYTFGLGYKVSSFAVNMGFLLDTYLGVKAAVDIRYRF